MLNRDSVPAVRTARGRWTDSSGGQQPHRHGGGGVTGSLDSRCFPRSQRGCSVWTVKSWVPLFPCYLTRVKHYTAQSEGPEPAPPPPRVSIATATLSARFSITRERLMPSDPGTSSQRDGDLCRGRPSRLARMVVLLQPGASVWIPA